MAACASCIDAYMPIAVAAATTTSAIIASVILFISVQYFQQQ
jgi:hypothetical protein